MTALLPLIFFLSGAAALVFETLWFNQAGLAFGNSVWSAALTIGSFMAGLALGNGLIARAGRRILRPIRLYAVLELAIAVTGVIIVLLLPALGRLLVPLFRPIAAYPWLINPVRLSVAFVVMVVPATAMGATLPLLVRALLHADPSFGSALGRLYGWNTLGAVCGALMGELVLMEAFGVTRSALAAGALNLTAAALALRVARAHEVPRAVEEPAAAPGRLGKRLLVAAFVSGGLMLGLEVVWFRFLMLAQAGTSLVFAVMLALVLAGIGLGGLIAARWCRRRPEAHQHLRFVALAAGVLVVAGYRGFHPLFEALGGPTDHSLGGLAIYAAVLMLPVSTLSGILFTLLGVAAKSVLREATRTVGLITLANTTGAAIGSAVAGFALLPILGMERAFFAIAVAYGGLALLLPGPGWSRRGMRMAVAVFGTSVLVFPFGHMQAAYFEPVAQRYRAELVEVREGVNQTAFYLRTDRFGQPSFYRLATDRYSMSATDPGSIRYMKLFVYLPVALLQNPKHGLLISYGVGSTASALAKASSFEHIDVVDVSRDIVELSDHIFDDPEQHPLRDPRVTVHIEDGRFFLQTTEQQYDLITGEPPPPKNAGIVNLYSREYFALIRERLKEGGLVSYWLPVHNLTEDDSLAILSAFCGVFEDCTLWAGSGLDWIMLGSRGAERRAEDAEFASQWNDPEIGRELRTHGVETPAQLGSLFMAGAAELQEVTRTVDPLIDDFPRRVSTRQIWVPTFSPLYAGLMHEPDALERFKRDDFVRRLWPESMRVASQPYFRHERAIKNALMPIYRGQGDYIWAELHALLSQTELRTAPLWLLGSNPREQAIVDALGSDHELGAEVDLVRAAGRIAGRDYSGAAQLLEDYVERVPADVGLRAYPTYVFALAMAGDLHAAARARDEAVAAGASGDPRFWAWMQHAFGLEPPR